MFCRQEDRKRKCPCISALGSSGLWKTSREMKRSRKSLCESLTISLLEGLFANLLACIFIEAAYGETVAVKFTSSLFI